MNIKIEKNIPLPDYQFGDGRPKKYPYDIMEVGDSFFIEKSEGQKVNITNWGRRTGFKFSLRSVPGGFRIWRIK